MPASTNIQQKQGRRAERSRRLLAVLAAIHCCPLCWKAQATDDMLAMAEGG
jgi:hypothetical protein